MRPALVTILPMFAAAILVMVGGEKMARRDLETRTPADRERLLDLDEAFRAELTRLDTLYLAHLDRLATRSLYEKPEEITTAASEIAGIRLIRIFRTRGNDLSIAPAANSRAPLEVELENGKRPLNPDRSVVIARKHLDQPLPKNGLWLDTPDPAFRIYCQQPEPDILAAILVDVSAARQRTTTWLTEWIETPITPLREAGERTLIASSTGTPLITTGPETHGPAASVIPIRSLFDVWQIRAWDGLVVTRSHDPATLAIATTLAAILTASGILLFLQQKRALKLAGQRVSFVNRVSHELGSPLTNLSLNLDLAVEALDSRPAEARRRLHLVTEEIERLARLVANVLTFSRRERNLLELTPIHCLPGEVIQQTLESFRPALERRGIEIQSRITAENPVILDPDALSQITGNLISNVEKYAASGRSMEILATLDSDQLTLEVRDQGPGIPAAARTRIFAPFERVRSTTNEGSSGTGLGLSIARDLAERMGGTLDLLDTSTGAAFRLRIPAPPALTIVSTDAA